MKLSNLNPKLGSDSVLVFDCPCGKCGGRIRVPLAPATDSKGQSWQHTGELANLTLVPSVNAGCWHGHIQNGEIVP